MRVSGLLAWLALGLLAVALAPLVAMVISSFGAGGAHFVEAWLSPGASAAAANSLRFALGSACIAVALGSVAAWLCERTQLPLRRTLTVAMVLPLFVPGALYSFAWVLLASPRIGLFNQPFADAPFNLYGHLGMAWVEGLHAAPMVYLLVAALLRSLDPEREQAARLAGATIWETFSRITLPMLVPVLGSTFLLVFVRAVGTFEVPAMLGLPAGIDVIASRIYRALQDYPGDTGPAAAYAAGLLLLTVLGIVVHERWAAPAQGYAAHQFAHSTAPRLHLGRARWPLGAFALVLSLVAAVLPLAALAWSSVQPFYSAPGQQSIAQLQQHLSLAGYREVLSSNQVRAAGWQTVRLAGGAATVIMVAGLAAAWALERRRHGVSRILEPAMNSVLALPGLVLGVALLVFHTRWSTGLYGTPWLLLLAYVTRFLPYGLRYGRSALGQIPRELELAAHCHGATAAQTAWRITLPLAMPSLLAGWLYTAAISARELSSSLLLYSPGQEVVTIVFWQFWEGGQLPQLSALSVVFVLALLAVALAANAVLRLQRRYF